MILFEHIAKKLTVISGGELSKNSEVGRNCSCIDTINAQYSVFDISPSKIKAAKLYKLSEILPDAQLFYMKKLCIAPSNVDLLLSKLLFEF